MTKSKTSSAMNGASWYIEKARSYVLFGDPCGAKSWLLTAKTLYPSEFTVQYEEFLMERKAGQKEKCAKLFYDMITAFSNEEILWDELARMFYAQDATRSQTVETRFLKEMFDSLPENHQKQLLLKYANNQKDLVDKSRISMLVLKRFKGAARDQAVKLITTLQKEEEKEYPDNVLNIYRKIIVCDILPIVLKHPDTQLVQQEKKQSKKDSKLLVTEDQLLCYLNLMMEFLVSLSIHKCSSLNNSTSSQPSKPLDSLGLDIDETVSSWNLLHENLLLFSNKLSWNNFLKFKDKIDPAKSRPLKSRWKTLNNARDSKPQVGLFYAVLQLHLHTVVQYCSAMSALSGSKVTSPHGAKGDQGVENEFVLVENIDQMTQREMATPGVIKTAKKKRKSDESGNYSSDYQSSSEDVTIVVHPGLIGQVSEGLGECLQVAIETQNFLKSSFGKEFNEIREKWKFEDWFWMNTFDTDTLLYQGKYRGAIERLSPEGSEDDITLKDSLKLSSVLFCSAQHKLACERALATVAMLSSSAFESNTPAEDKNISKPDGRSLVVLSNSPTDVLTYAVQIIFAALKSRLYGEGEHRDAIIGHLIVLSQLLWSRNENFFLDLLKLIQSQEGGFKYSLFFTYVTQIDIIEEFAYLHAQGSVALELREDVEVVEVKKNVTRGVNRGVEDDFKSSVMRQVGKSHRPVRNIIYNFLSNEGESILEVL